MAEGKGRTSCTCMRGATATDAEGFRPGVLPAVIDAPRGRSCPTSARTGDQPLAVPALRRSRGTSGSVNVQFAVKSDGGLGSNGPCEAAGWEKCLVRPLLTSLCTHRQPVPRPTSPAVQHIHLLSLHCQVT